MKRLLVLSGKGGTGKTTVASALIKLAGARAYADCDVDAPNLHLLTNWSIDPEVSPYYGLPKASIAMEKCIACDQCRIHCRFDAIIKDGGYRIDPYACEGCGVCEYVCPSEAISLEPMQDGTLLLYADSSQVFSTATLRMGSGTSGMLVTEVKKQMVLTAPDEAELAIIDGSPGIGCPVIASLSGVDMVLIVAEPSVSGISDMQRVIHTANVFGVKVAVCINKFDTNPEHTKEIKDFCKRQELPCVGEIPFDPWAVQAINSGQTIVDIECAAGTAVKAIYGKCRQLLER